MRAATVLALLLGCSASLSAQEHPITWTLKGSPAQAAVGKVFTARLSATIPFGWHLYSLTQPPGGPIAMDVTIPGSEFALQGTIGAPPPDVAPDPNFQIETETYTDSLRLTVPVVARVTGARTLTVNVHYQTCTDRYCLPPTTDVLSWPVTVTGAGGGAAPAATPAAAVPVAPEPAPPPAPAATATSPRVVATPPATTLPAGGTAPQSLAVFLWLAVAMGALSLLTPCVFPMIPITVSYFTRTNEQRRGSATRNALLYAVGIMATFTLLGMAIAILVGAGGINRFAANPWINLLVTGLFVAFALNLFGVWQVTLPSALLTRLEAVSQGGTRGETFGILAMGLTFTLTSFTCTAPFVGTLLVLAAQGSWEWPLLGLLVFSAVFALPFFLLALMPSAVARLPRSGTWLGSVKVVLGFVELATAMKFLANADLIFRWGVISRTVVLAVWLAVAVATALYLLGIVPWRPAGSIRRLAPARLLGAFASLACGVVLARGLGGRPLGELESFLPPPEGAVTSGTIEVRDGLSWMVNDLDGALARATREDKLVMVDFTGYTCTNCRWMESNMFPRPEVRRELETFVRVRLYTDGLGDVYRNQQQYELDRFGTVALPFYVVLDQQGNPRSQLLGMTRSSDEFLRFLRGRGEVSRIP
jgi:thiol:disulfide interchange protein DsbD